IDSIFDHGEKAIALFERTNDQANLADVSAELAYEYIDENDLERCEKLIFNAIAIYEALEDDKGLGRAYHTMAKIFRSQKDPESAIKYALEAVEFSKKSNDHQTAALAWSVLILAYHDVGELEKAIQAGANSIDILTRFVPEDPFTLARAYGYRGEVWADSGNYQKALEDNLKSYAIVEAEIGAERPAAQTYRQGIGQAYFLQGKYKEALPHLEASIEGYNKLGQSRHPAMQADYEEIAACYYQLGYYQKAFFYQGLAFEIFDTLMQNKVANLESEALIKYESGKKDQALEEQATMIKQKNRIQLLGIGLIVLLLLFLGTLFYYFRRNQKTAKALLTKNQENELLLKEIHHRVKNNLQVISSLLNMQSRSIKDTEVRSAIRESQARVQSMSLIHQKLYRGKNLAAIEMKGYLQTLADNLIDAYMEEEEVEVKVDMQQLELDVDYAIPLGLIVNELITNSLKYAFPKQKKGAIEIKMKQNQDKIILEIGDNGVGEKATTVKKDGSGFGSELIELLTMQLKGKLDLSTDNGYHTRLSFPFSKSTQLA
ncbi:MAG: tetratricopeptide repeat protein, partial [Bacteroidetes bacterium]|nr:tetratricopeptide repeat protein [Bacteroidota bacterium]